MISKLQFITHQTQRFTYFQSAEIALKAGCKWIQLRMKETSDEEFIKVGHNIHIMCKYYGAKLILDDRVHLVHKLSAAGVHLGKNDMPIKEARQMLSDDKIIIGGTANTFDDITNLVQQGVDYIGCGPFRYTKTKANLAPIIGFKGYNTILNKKRQNNITTPIIAIGGITINDIDSLLTIGLDGIAVSSTVLSAENPINEMKKLLKLIKHYE